MHNSKETIEIRNNRGVSEAWHGLPKRKASPSNEPNASWRTNWDTRCTNLPDVIFLRFACSCLDQRTVGGRSRRRPEDQTTQQGRELSVDGGGRVFQVRLGDSPQEKDGTPNGLGPRDSVENEQEDASKTPDGRREGILQQTRGQSVEREGDTSLFHGGRYQSQCGGTI